MREHRYLQMTLLLVGIAALLYLAVSLYIPSSNRMLFGIDRDSGQVRVASGSVAFLPPHIYRRNSFVSREGSAQIDGIARVLTSERVPVQINYRLRFRLDGSSLPEARTIVLDGWRVWFDRRVAEAARAVAAEIPIDDLANPVIGLRDSRQAISDAVTTYLSRNGVEVTAFAIQNVDVSRQALLDYKRQQLRRETRGAIGTVAVIGIDGLDWDLIDGLTDAGQMPNLASMINQGATASLRSVQPLISPVVWTSLSTGMTPSRHGIVSLEPSRAANLALPRRAPTMAEIAASFGKRTVAVDWPGEWPPLDNSDLIVFDDEVGRPRPVISHDELEDLVSESLVPAATIGERQLERFVEGEISLESGTPETMLRDTLAQTWTNHRTGINLYQRERPELLLLGIHGTDTIHHVFAPYSPPRRSGVDWREYDKYYPALINYYAELDRLIGEWLGVLPEDATLIVVSASGSRWGESRPREMPADRYTVRDHGDRGVLVAYGNGVEGSRRVDASILDVAPTILSLLGLPPSAEMKGSPLTAGFDVEPITRVRITSYNDLIDLDSRRNRSHDFDLSRFERHQQDVGHLNRPSDRGPVQEGRGQIEDWGRYAWLNNEGVRRARDGKDGAVDMLAEASRLNPGRIQPKLNLAVIALDNTRLTSAENLLEEIHEIDPVRAEQLYVDLAAWYRQPEQNMTTRAINLLATARELYPSSLPVARAYGAALAAGERYTDAIEVFENALALDPGNSEILNDLGWIHADREEYDVALEYWNRSLAIQPRQPKIAQALEAAISRL